MSKKINTRRSRTASRFYYSLSERQLANYRRHIQGQFGGGMTSVPGSVEPATGQSHPYFETFVMGGVGFLLGYTAALSVPFGWGTVATSSVAIAGGQIGRALGAPPGFAAGATWGARLGLAQSAWNWLSALPGKSLAATAAANGSMGATQAAINTSYPGAFGPWAMAFSP